MTYSQSYKETLTLKSGLAVRIRAIRPDDKAMTKEIFHNLDPELIYSRYFYPKKTLTEGELKAITEVDFFHVVALVVTIGPEDDETIIAGARYACSETHGVCHEAEVAFTVQPEYQGQGIASMLLQRLASIARERGISRLKAEMLAKNQAMLTVFSRSGLPMQSKTERGIIYVTMMLNGNQG